MKILPHADVRHALSSAVGSSASLDVNLKLFELVGRLALRGLWKVWQLTPPNGPVVLSNDYLQTLPTTMGETTKTPGGRIDRLCQTQQQTVRHLRELVSAHGGWQARSLARRLLVLDSRPSTDNSSVGRREVEKS